METIKNRIMLADSLVYEILERSRICPLAHKEYWKKTILWACIASKHIPTINQINKWIGNGFTPEAIEPSKAIRNILVANGLKQISRLRPKGINFDSFPFSFETRMTEYQIKWIENEFLPYTKSKLKLKYELDSDGLVSFISEYI